MGLGTAEGTTVCRRLHHPCCLVPGNAQLAVGIRPFGSTPPLSDAGAAPFGDRAEIRLGGYK